MKILFLAFVFAGFIIAIDAYCDRRKRKKAEENEQQQKEST